MTPFQQRAWRNLQTYLGRLSRGEVKHEGLQAAEPQTRHDTIAAIQAITRALEVAAGYDFTAVVDLVYDISNQLTDLQLEKLKKSGVPYREPYHGFSTMTLTPETEKVAHIEHGGLFVPPDDFVFLGWRLAGSSMGALLVRNWEAQVEGRRSFDVFGVFHEEPGRVNMRLAGLLVDYDDDTFIIRPDLRFTDRLKPESKHLVQVTVQFALACVICLNSPYGIERETVPAHKGQARELRKQGVTLHDHCVIRLSRKPPPEHAIRGEGSGKAFHFVRSHRRHYRSGNTTIVRAHFRGDPRLGTTSGGYEVRK